MTIHSSEHIQFFTVMFCKEYSGLIDSFEQ